MQTIHVFLIISTSEPDT